MRTKYMAGAVAIALGVGFFVETFFSPVHSSETRQLAQAGANDALGNTAAPRSAGAGIAVSKAAAASNEQAAAANSGTKVTPVAALSNIPAEAPLLQGEAPRPQFLPPPPIEAMAKPADTRDKDDNLFVKPQEGAKIAIANAKAARDIIRTQVGASQDDDFTLKSTKRDSLGNTYYKFTQTYQNIPVFGREVVVQADAGQSMKSLSGDYKPGIELSLVAQLDGTTAVNMALSKSGDPILGEPKIHDKPQLWVYADNNATPVLTYRTVVEYTKSRAGYQIDELFVDANSGKVVATHPQVFSGLSRETRTASNACLNQYNQNSVLPGQVVAQDKDAAAKSAYDNMGTTYWFYKDWLSRDSLDGRGAPLKSTLHLLFDGGWGNCTGDNAMYTPAYGMLVGNGGSYLHDISGALDIVAHELTHGVTANESALVYQNESGAINEALSDIFGNAAEAWRDSGGTSTANPTSGLKYNANNWIVGEAASVAGKAVRYMNDPAKDGQSKDNYDTRYVGTQDAGGVHTNSGIMNLAFYLLASGGTHPRGATNVNVTGIGAEKALKIYYHAATNLFTSTTDFKSARNLLAQSAETLYGNCSQEYKSVQQSWDAVKVPGTWSCGTGTSAGGSGAPGGGSPAGGNIALGATASASSSYSAANSPGKMNDGNMNTFWASRNIYSPYAQEWVILDFGSGKAANTLTIKWAGTNFARQYAVWVQKNNQWVMVKSEYKSAAGDSTISLNTPSTRYVAVTMSGGNVWSFYGVKEMTIQ